MLEGLPDDTWMACVAGPASTGTAGPLLGEADWRGHYDQDPGEKDTPSPGDRLVEVKSRDYCSSRSRRGEVPAVKYDFAYLVPGGGWNAGNRRSVCWAKTSQ